MAGAALPAILDWGHVEARNGRVQRRKVLAVRAVAVEDTKEGVILLGDRRARQYFVRNTDERHHDLGNGFLTISTLVREGNRLGMARVVYMMKMTGELRLNSSRIIRTALVAYVLSTSLRAAASQPRPYPHHEAYKVYAAIAPRVVHEVLRHQPRKFVIRSTTASIARRASHCFPAKYDNSFAEGYKNFQDMNSTTWTLLPRFRFDRPYEFVSEDQLDQMVVFVEPRADLPDSGGSGFAWHKFFEQYPNSSGYFVFSAVGFNRSNTQAVIRATFYCGGLCAGESYYLLVKRRGRWRVLHASASCGFVS